MVIDFDHNATTALDARIAAAMYELALDRNVSGNPSSIHQLGRRARALLEDARADIAACVGARADEVVFTSGGTEADNLAVLGICRGLRSSGKPSGLLTSRIEHPAVLGACAQLAREGHACVFVDLDDEGRLDPNDVAAAVSRHADVGLVSLSAANHELGNRYDIGAIVEGVRRVSATVLVHTDAVQACGKVAIDVRQWDADLLSLSAHKVYGPVGVGALVVRHRPHLQPLMFGGLQERGMRPGSEPALLAHGFALALSHAQREFEQRRRQVAELRAGLIAGLEMIEGARVQGDLEVHIGNTVNVEFERCDAQLLVMGLDLEGVAVSAGAACSSGTPEPSAVLLALGRSRVRARSAVRFSLGHDNTSMEVDRVLALLPPIVDRVRAACEHTSGREEPSR